MLNELLRRRADLSREEALKLVEEKKNNVGGGYLTDQGALFLVASDLGTRLKIEEVRPRIGELEPSQSGVSFISRILSFGPPRRFTRKSDSSIGILSKMVVYDATSVATVSIWNENLLSQILAAGIRPGSPVKVSDAYTRADLNGSVSINLSVNGAVEKLEESDALVSDIPKFEEVGRIFESKTNFPLIVRGKIMGEIRKSEYAKKSGGQGQIFSFGLVPEGSESETRVVLWNNLNPSFEGLQENHLITLVNVRKKESEYQGNKSIELHGDETTLILEKWEQDMKWLSHLSLESAREPKKIPSTQDNEPTRMLAFVGRVLSLGQQLEKESAHLLVVDSSKRKISLTALNEAVIDAAKLKADSVIVFKPDSFDAVGLKAVCTKAGSISCVRSERKDIPYSVSLFSEVERVIPLSIVSLDVMSLSDASSREIQTKEGLVRRTEVMIGDPTGEIKIYAWRGLSKILDKITAGSRLKFEAVEIQSHEGKKFAVFKSYSKLSLSG